MCVTWRSWLERGLVREIRYTLKSSNFTLKKKLEKFIDDGIDKWPTRGKLIEGVFHCELKLFILALAASIERAILMWAEINREKRDWRRSAFAAWAKNVLASVEPADFIDKGSAIQWLGDWATNAHAASAVKFCVSISWRICLRGMPVCFHVIQRSDRKIDDHDDEQEKQFAEDCFNQLTKKSVQYGLSSKQEKCWSQRLKQRIWLALFGGLNLQIGLSC